MLLFIPTNLGSPWIMMSRLSSVTISSPVIDRLSSIGRAELMDLSVIIRYLGLLGLRFGRRESSAPARGSSAWKRVGRSRRSMPRPGIAFVW